MNQELFDQPAELPLAPGAWLLRGHALAFEQALLDAAAAVVEQAAWRRMLTPGGQAMSVAMTNCGALGWVSDATGYRYQARDPLGDRPWPALPAVFTQIARTAAAQAGFADFQPDACLINRYLPGNKMGLHQDRDERDFTQPIVSVSLGLPALFLFGGLRRADKPARLTLQHGDVVVWGGPSRLAYHGVLALADGEHPRLGAQRINLTLRRAG